MNIHFDGAVGPYERVLWASEPAVGLRAVIAVHSTRLGPAAGGVRLHAYGDDVAACIDALRLADAMTMKAAAAGLDLGGGKSVILADPRAPRTPALLHAFGRMVNRLDGLYLAAADVGTSLADIRVLADVTPHLLGLAGGHFPDGIDSSPHTADGVVAAMRAVWAWGGGGRDLAGARVAVQGVGKVGAAVARRAVHAGARVVVADVDERRAAAVASEIGAATVPAARILASPCDILAPCALGGVVTHRTLGDLHCRWIVGSANNQLASDDLALALADAAIGYVPDFVANAGGLISLAGAHDGLDGDEVARAVARVGDTVHDLLEATEDHGGTLLDHALARGRQRLARRVRA